MLVDIEFKGRKEIIEILKKGDDYSIEDSDLEKEEKEIWETISNFYLYNHKKLTTGIYEVDGGFNFDHYLEDILNYSVDSFFLFSSKGAFGTCDNHEQVLQRYPELYEDNDAYFVTLIKVRKEDQPEKGGWRWHKFGAYIGDKNPQKEYLADEPEIDEVYCYHIYKIVDY